MTLHVLLFVSTSCSVALCDVIATTDAPKAEFVNVLKRDLRRNNDDYLESTIGTINITNPYLIRNTTSSNTNQQTDRIDKFYFSTRATNGNKVSDDAKNEPRRRAFDTLEIAEHNDPVKEQVPTNVTTQQLTLFQPVVRTIEKRISKRPIPSVSILLSSVTNVLTTTRDMANFRSNNVKSKQDIHGEKLKKFKTFIDKNKQLFNEFVSKKQAAQATRAPLSLPPANPAGFLSRIQGKVDYEGGKNSERGRGGLRERLHSGEGARLSPNNIDMAPARGGHIHALRIKGRLCQRNVLVPEGPKYDSKGKAYLNAYGHKKGRDYAKTPRPKLLLPRCCNCCKKSVLGCE